MRSFALVALLLLSTSASFGQMTVEQKLVDFQTMVALYAKQYAPYEWKKTALNYDLFNTQPWLTRIRASRTDLDYYEILAEYVASLGDVHSQYFNPSTFVARLGFDVDLYDGKVLIDTIDRSLLPLRDYRFVVGDELVLLDGKTPEQWIQYVNRFQSFGNKRSTDRWSAGYIAYRDQGVIPRAAEEIGETANVVIRRQNGEQQTYTIPWNKSGHPLTNAGLIPNTRDEVSEPAPAAKSKVPVTLRPLFEMQILKPRRKLSAKGFGQIAPTFRLPATFIQRRNSYFHVGVYEAGGYRIGFLRIPEFQPTDYESLGFAISSFDREIRYLQANTDGLVVDVMRNPGGYGCYGEELIRRLMPAKFRGASESIRPSTRLITAYREAIEEAKIPGFAEDWEVALLSEYARQIEEADRQPRGMTGPIPLCSLSFERDPVSVEADGLTPYNKPIVLLTDEFTTSAGDLFAATFQDAKRGPVVGWRTSGAGGAVETKDVGFYSEGQTGVTVSLLLRPDPINVPDYPTSWFIENVGVRPDITIDYMTRENLLNNGQPFVTAFTNVIVEEIKKTGTAPTVGADPGNLETSSESLGQP
jgi:hypothetical protein